MRVPRMSVVVITARPGGLDVLLTGLSRQEFTDFEVVLVDALFHLRRDVVGDAFATARVRVVHTPPRQRVFPYDACPQARNMGIAKARGELIVWLVDYSYVAPRGLYEHWGIWEHTNREFFGMGAHRYFYPPGPVYLLPSYAPLVMFPPEGRGEGVTYQYSERASREYAAELASGRYQSSMYSIFDPPLVEPGQIGALCEDPYFFHADPKLVGLVGGRVPPTAFHAKNESVSAELCRRVNGFDEAWDGHCYDDSDMGLRLSRAGAQWILMDPVATVAIVNPRHYFPHLVWRNTPDATEERFRQYEQDATRVVSGNAVVLEQAMGPWWYR